MDTARIDSKGREMIRNLKVLGLALAAVLAMAAVTASAASAQGKLTSTGPVTLTAVEKVGAPITDNRLTAFGSFVQCPGSTYTGHKVLTLKETEELKKHQLLPSVSTEATLTPHYKQTDHNCTGPLGTVATVDMNGCDYVIRLGATTGGVAGTYGVTFDVVCPTGKTITVTIWLNTDAHTAEPDNAKCTLHVGSQSGLHGAHATDNGNGTVDIKGTVTPITVTQTRHSILCPSGTHTSEATFDLNVTVSGKSELGGPTNISLSH
jgi:hypothetical protein